MFLFALERGRLSRYHGHLGRKMHCGNFQCWVPRKRCWNPESNPDTLKLGTAVAKGSYVRFDEVSSATSIGKCVGWKQNLISPTSLSPIRYIKRLIKPIKSSQEHYDIPNIIFEIIFEQEVAYTKSIKWCHLHTSVSSSLIPNLSLCLIHNARLSVSNNCRVGSGVRRPPATPASPGTHASVWERNCGQGSPTGWNDNSAGLANEEFRWPQ